MSPPVALVTEQDPSGHTGAVYEISSEGIRPDGKRAYDATRWSKVAYYYLSFDWRSLVRNVFLPAGYPASVSPDYLEVQIYYGLQAFCSSLAGLIASRAVLEGHGIGKAEASATHAVLLTVLQDAFSRLATIIGAYYLGTLLSPEAKTYRLIADITNDIAIVFDLLSPQLSAFTLTPRPPFIARSPGPSLRVIALCLSGAFRALCGVTAGGSRAAITLHFAQDASMPGDVGDLSAKDASKETVLALLGMLCGSMLMPYLRTAERTYTVVAILLILHIWANYAAVRVVVMKSLNRQRATILWAAYSELRPKAGDPSAPEMIRRVLTPSEVASREHLFGRNASLLQYLNGRSYIRGYATIGGSFGSILPSSSLSSTTQSNNTAIRHLLDIFSDRKYVIGLNTRRTSLHIPLSTPHISVVLKDGHTPGCHLEAWILANTIANTLASSLTDGIAAGALSNIKARQERLDSTFKEFVTAIQRAGWNTDTIGIVTGSPKTISIQDGDDRKNR